MSTAKTKTSKPPKNLTKFGDSPRGGVNPESIRAANKRLPPNTVGLNPYWFSTITISENDYYSLAVFALRYAMGGGSIGRESIISDIIRNVGISELGERIAVVFCADYEDYVKQFPTSRCVTDEFSEWHRGYAWFKALRDDSFALVHCEGKDSSGRKIKEDAYCFESDGKWHNAVLFQSNQSVRCIANPEFIKSIEKNFGWRQYLQRRRFDTA